MLRLTSTTHKNSKVSKCLQCWQTEWQRSCRTQSCRFIAQKGSIRFTKLPLPCNSVHDNSYTKTKAQEFFFHCYIISCCTELHETCTKHKMRKLHTFLACPLLASSDRNADFSYMNRARVFVWQFRAALSIRQRISLNISTKIVFDLSQWQQNHNTTTQKKELPFLLSCWQHFAGDFASKPMTLPEIDHVIYVAAHA